jgi:hypothetical protein
MGKKFNDFWFDLKIFLKYILAKPFMELASMFKMFYAGAGKLDKPYFWVRFFGMLTLFLILVGVTTKYWIPAYVAVTVTLIALIRFEWISGRFRKWHVEKLKKRAKRQMEANINGE